MRTMVFISQPMRGLSDEEIIATQRKIYDEVAADYEDPILINPFSPRSEQMDVTEFIGNSDVYLLGTAITQLAFADVLVMAKGWENFRGCRIERKVATYYDIPIRYA